MGRNRKKLAACPNCGRALAKEDNYCARCGQENHTHRLPAAYFVRELLAGILAFDTTLFRTLRDLFLPPGLVIREFNANKRARYLPPLRLYLFTSLIFFIVLSWNTERIEQDAPEIRVASGEVGTLEVFDLDFEDGRVIPDSVLMALTADGRPSDEQVDLALMTAGVEPDLWHRVNVRLAINLNARGTSKVAFVRTIITSFSKVMFVLLPLFAALLYLLYWRKAIYFAEHLVFALYYQSVLFILIGTYLLIDRYFEISYLSGPLLLLGFIYLVWALRTVHKRSWWSSVLKAIFLDLSYLLLLALGVVTAAVMGAVL